MSRRQVRAGWRARLRRQEQAAPQPVRKILAPAHISVHIAELHMQSFRRSEAIRIADGLQHELSSLLASEGVPRPWLHSSNVEAIRLNDIRAGKPQIIAQHLAQALVRTKEKDGREGK